MKKGILLVVLVLLIPFCLGATLHGKVFDYNFRLAKNSVVQINTAPEQIMVAVDGNYSFNVPLGNYTLTAFEKGTLNRTLSLVEDNISVISSGDYVHDLIMFPNSDLGELDLDDNVTFDVITPAQVQTQNTIIIIAGLVIIALFIWICIIAFKKGKVFNKFVFTKKPQLQGEEKDDLTELSDFIMRNKRVTQKDIRKEFPMSEAKISLMITDLESQHKVRKIKKGRGNIIVWNEK